MKPNLSTTILALCMFVTYSFAATQATFWVSPGGTGTAFSQQSPGSLFEVRAKIRTLNTAMTGDIIVNLKGGTYWLDSTFILRANDGGTNGFRITYQAASGELPVISGGKKIQGWTPSDPAKGIYSATVGTSLQTRQLFVNGVRAQRARGPQDPSGFTKTSTGYTTTDTLLQHFQNIGDMEVVGYTEWKCYRCPIASISANTITMQEPCWTNTQGHAGYTLNVPTWVENAYEYLDAAGEWYLNRSSGVLYYKPRVGENMATVEAVVAVKESLVVLNGSPAIPVNNIDFKGITFSHGTWLQPNTDLGFPEMQATYQWNNGLKAPANVIVAAGHNITFERCTFTHLGGAGIAFEAATQRSSIVGCQFSDISANGIHIGNVDGSPAAGTEVSHNTIENNYITATAAEYKSAVGIFAGYTDSTVIAYNEIVGLPYTGISSGWGWNNANNLTHDVKIHHNLIKNVLMTLKDGGGIYTLSGQHGSEVSYNFIQNVGSNNGLYPDEGSSFMHWHHNVVSQVPRWLHMWTGTITYDTVENNWRDGGDENLQGTNCIVRNNTLITGGVWPSDAQAVMTGAGLQAGYTDIRPSNITTPVLIGWWKFDESTGTTAYDSSGSGYDGIVAAGTWTTGKIGGALEVHTLNSVTMPGPIGPMPTFSVAFWLYPNSHSDYNQVVGNGWGTFTFHTTQTGGVYCGTYENRQAVGSRFTPTELPAVVDINTWQHFAYTFDNGIAKFYKNGVVLAQGNHAIPQDWPGFMIQWVDGKIDDLRIYNGAIDAASVVALSSQQPTKNIQFKNESLQRSKIMLRSNAQKQYIIFGSGLSKTTSIELMDVNGRVIDKEVVGNPFTLSAGMHIVRLRDAQFSRICKFVVP